MHTPLLIIGEEVNNKISRMEDILPIIDSIMEPYCEDIDYCGSDMVEFEEEFSLEEAEKEFGKISNERKRDYGTVDNFMKEYYGYSKNEDNDGWGHFTNPCSFWDWYKLGGRFGNQFAVKAGADKYKGEIGTYPNGSAVPDTSADICLIKDLDFEAMKKNNRLYYEAIWDENECKFSLDDLSKDDEEYKKRVQYRGWDRIKEDDTKETYLSRVPKPFGGYSVDILDYCGYNSGGLVLNGKNADECYEELRNFFSKYSPNAWIALIDYHC